MTPFPLTAFTLPAAGEDLARRVDRVLARFLHAQREAVASSDSAVGGAFDELDRVVGSGGKRLRPVFCCLGHLAGGGGVEDEILRVAAALELLHTFALVHDDVMDRSAVRRGEPTTWMYLADEHRRSRLRGDPDGYGISSAVLVGDLALTLADQAFLESGFPAERLVPGLWRYNRMRTDMVAGQFLDVVAAQRGRVEETEARRIAVLKSGAYSVEGPLHIGAILAGASPAVLSSLSAYGVALGEAFQLRDDVLGVFGQPAVTGKDRDSDLREGKRTVLVARAMRMAAPEDRRFLDERLGRRDLTPDDVDRMRSIIERSGALAGTLSLISELAARAKAAVDGLPTIGATLTEMVDALAEREL